MNARTSRSAKADNRSAGRQRKQSGNDGGADLPLDDLLDARFDEEGRLAQIGRGSRQRVAERLDPRPPAMSADELERAVQKLAQGLDAIERRSRSGWTADAPPSSPGSGPVNDDEPPRERDFVTYSLDRLEARLEALSQRLEQRAGEASQPSADAPPEAATTPLTSAPVAESAPTPDRDRPAAPPIRADEPSLAVDPRTERRARRSRGRQNASRARREAEAVVEFDRREARQEAERDQSELRRQAEEAAVAEAAAKRDSERKTRHLAEAEAMEAKRRAEAEEAERRAAAEAEAARLEADAQAERKAQEAKRRSEAEEAALLAAIAEAEAARQRAESKAAAARQQAADAEASSKAEVEAAEERATLAARREAESAAEMQRQFAEIESRIDALQKVSDENQIEPVRNELLAMLRQIEDIGHDGRTVGDALMQIGTRLDEMEVKVNAARNMAGNRLGDIQDRLTGLTERLGEMEYEIPGFDAVRENQGAILERFDRMEGLVNQLAVSEDLVDRVDGLKRQMQTIAAKGEMKHMEEQILQLADRLDALPDHMNDRPALERIEAQLQTLAAELVEAHRERKSAGAEFDRRLADLSSALAEVGESGRTPDLSGLEAQITDLGKQLYDDRHANGEALTRLEGRVATLAAAVAEQENDADAQMMGRFTEKLDALSKTVEAQEGSARRDIGVLDRKLDRIAGELAEQAERTREPQTQHLEERFEQMQAQLEGLVASSGDSAAQLAPLANQLQDIANRVGDLGIAGAQTPLSQRLAAIEERIAALVGKGDTRALQNQLEAIVSRLELLKGRSIDPARLNELFDRVDAAIRIIPEDRFERLEQTISSSAEQQLAQDRFDRLEKRIAETVRRIVPHERFDRLERKIAESAQSHLAEDRFDRLEKKMAAIVGGGVSDERFDRLEEQIAAGTATQVSAEQFRALEQKLTVDRDDAASAQRFARLEQKLDAIGRAYTVNGDILTQDDLSELSADITALRRELRSLPGLGEGEGNLGEVLETISARLDRLPDQPPATAAEFEAQIDRITELLEDPSQSRLALAHIKTSLKAIEEQLQETRSAFLDAPSSDSDASEAEIETVAGLARSLSDDVTTLRSATEASEAKTKHALDAVQETLEAVVKRMAFLERDADMAAAPRPHGADLRDDKPAPSKSLPAAASTAAATSQLPEPTLVDADASERSDAPAPAEPSAPAAGSGGLFSRLTSRQLLRRATGGRAESFTPETEESEDETDQPLEPGTDAPLRSSLSGAPSSDTQLMSGDRSARLDLPIEAPAADAPGSGDAPVDEDFLAAARRAARAAAQEAADSERQEVSRGLFSTAKKRRRALLAAALVVAVAFAAVQIIRTQLSSGELQLASGSDAAAPASERALPSAVSVAPAADETSAAEAPLASDPPTAARAPAEPIVAASDPAGTEAPASTDSATPDEAPVMAASSDEAAGTAAPQPSVAASKPESADDTPALADATDDPASTMAAAAADDPAPMAVAGVETQPASPPTTDPIPAATDAATVTAALRVAEPDATAPAIPVALGSELLRESAMTGDPAAAFEVAARFTEGARVPQNLPAAVLWYERAAGAGLAPAQYRLGSIFEKGMGVTKDMAKAQVWYRRAADSGNVKAMHNLAVLSAEGAGGEPDLVGAAALFRQAAEHGVRDSQFNLAILHARGLGVPQDLIEAYKWFAIAAGSGDEEAAKRRDIIAAALNDSDLAKAKFAAEGFQPLPLIAESNEVMMPEGGWGDAPRLDATSLDLDVGITEEEAAQPTENELIALVQKLLADQGFDPGPADGLLGRKTIQAITEFQGKAGLPATGQIDPAFMQALKEQST